LSFSSIKYFIVVSLYHIKNANKIANCSINIAKITKLCYNDKNKGVKYGTKTLKRS
jgi:hypothetical protein